MKLRAAASSSALKITMPKVSSSTVKVRPAMSTVPARTPALT